MRVLHVQRAKGIGGSERHLLTLLPGLAAEGVDVRMHVLAAGDGARFVDELENAGVSTSSSAAGPDVNPLSVATLVAEIRRFRPDVVHTHLVHADLHGQVAALLTRVPGVSSVHGTPAFYQRHPYRLVGRSVGKMARRRIAISEHVARFVRHLGLAPADHIRVVPYGIAIDTMRTTVAEARSARARYGFAVSERVIGVAARLIPGKGHDVLIEGFGDVARSDDTLRLAIAGTGPEQPRLEALAASTCPSGAVRFLGFVDDVRGFFAACDVLAFPTQPELGEGFGLAALEAMAAGRPVVATDVGSLPEVVDHGVTGMLVPAHSAQALGATVARLATDPELSVRLGTAGAERAATCFPLSLMVERTRRVYEELG